MGIVVKPGQPAEGAAAGGSGGSGSSIGGGSGGAGSGAAASPQQPKLATPLRDFALERPGDTTLCHACKKQPAPAGNDEEAVVLQRCSGCGLACYCSVECQRSVWPAHKFECREFAEARRIAAKESALRLAAGTQSQLRPAAILAEDALCDPWAHVPLERVQRAAESGYAPAQHHLGNRLRGSEHTLETAAQWWRRAADQGLAVAQNAYAYYLLSRRTDADLRAALPYFRRAAAAGHPQALGVLGDYYDQGIGGVAPDPREAAAWWKRAAKVGDTESAERLANL
jgi:hypothetical protein